MFSRRISKTVLMATGLCAAIAMGGCAPEPKADNGEGASMDASIAKAVFGKMPDGTEVDLYTLRNANGATVTITNYGGIVTSLTAPDKDGNFADVVLGFDTLEPYLERHPYFGATIGRYGNRIAFGKFTLDGTEYTLAANNDANHLHGGNDGFDRVVWHAEEATRDDAVGLKLHYLSKDMEEGYPGNLDVHVEYWLTNDNALECNFKATTDKATPINLTHHGYFNLTGMKDTILGHEMMISAGRYTPVDEGLIPTGELASVEGTPMDFRTATAIGARIASVTGGYDHNYVLDGADGSLKKQVEVYEPTTGRVLEVLTTEPGVQFYTGNFLDGTNTGKGGTVYQKNYGFCLEPQHYPDSPNQPDFPSAILRPGETYTHQTVYKFSAR